MKAGSAGPAQEDFFEGGCGRSGAGRFLERRVRYVWSRKVFEKAGAVGLEQEGFLESGCGRSGAGRFWEGGCGRSGGKEAAGGGNRAKLTPPPHTERWG